MREGPLSAFDLSGYKRSKPLRCWTVDLSHKEIGVSVCNPESDPLGAALLDADSLIVTCMRETWRAMGSPSSLVTSAPRRDDR